MQALVLVRRSAVTLHRGAAGLGVEAAGLAGQRRAGRPPRLRPDRSLEQQLEQTLQLLSEVGFTS